MKKTTAILVFLATTVAWSEDKLKFNFVNEEITKTIEVYAKASGQKFIVDSTVRGKITILNPTEVSVEEAFNQVSESLAINGFGIVKQGDVFTVKNARSVQRDNIQVSSEVVPSLKPQRMAMWIVTLKYISAQDAIRDLRVLTSSYGEISSNTSSNQLIITDWTSNIQRVAELIKQVDKPADASLAKIIAAANKERKDMKEAKKEIKEVKEIKN